MVAIVDNGGVRGGQKAMLGLTAGLNHVLGTVSGRRDEENMYLDGNFAPVEKEVEASELVVMEGTLPADLKGAYVRNGPNPAFKPETGYHWFDGDGMLHAVRFKDGKASCSSRYVQTAKLELERAAGGPVYLKIGDMRGPLGLFKLVQARVCEALGILKPDKGLNHTANTSILTYAKEILAVCEAGVPYSVRILCTGIVETLGAAAEFEGNVKKVTAHPKVDPETKEMVFYGYDVSKAPYVTVGFMNCEGKFDREIEIFRVQRPVMIHDMAMSKQYGVIFDMPLVFEPKLVMENKIPFVLLKDLPSRFGVFKRDMKSEKDVKWFEVPGGAWISHTANAWDESNGKKLHVVAVRQPNMDLNSLNRKDGSENEAALVQWTFDMVSGSSSWRPMVSKDTARGDFPVINPHYACRKMRFVYMVGISEDEGAIKFCKLQKIDIDKAATDSDRGLIAEINYPPNVYSGEMLFVPRFESPEQCDGEDDGFLVGYQHNESDSITCFTIYDAKTMSPTPLCRLAMPQRIPYGFHGTHLNETEFQAQLKANK